jgi:hypothetical protein
MKYELVTAGEGLAYLVSQKLLTHVPWGTLSQGLVTTGRSEQLIEFFEEMTVINLTCRIVAAGTSLLKATEDRPARQTDDPGFVSDFHRFLRLNLSIPREHQGVIFRQGERALKAVSNDITANERAAFRRQAQNHRAHCYMCGVALSFADQVPAPVGPEDRDARKERERLNARCYTCEHIWPQCYGGDSIDDNLLPACVSCNSSKKMEYATWAMANIQSLILGMRPRDNELVSVSGSHRFALHHYAARKLAARKRITMKRAFLELRPWTDVRLYEGEETGDFFTLVNYQ